MLSSDFAARRIAILAISALAMIAMAVSLAASTAAAPPSSPPNQPINVIVANTPLPVTGDVGVSGSVEISGTVDAAQSGTWDVGITGTPTVKTGDATTLLGSFAGTVEGGSAFTEAVQGANATSSRTVRVITNCFAGGACANINVRVYTVVGSRSYLIEQFPMQNFVVAGGVYEVIGTNISVQLQNHNAGPIENIGVAVFGHP